MTATVPATTAQVIATARKSLAMRPSGQGAILATRWGRATDARLQHLDGRRFGVLAPSEPGHRCKMSGTGG
jgi:hypothetical protein